MEYLDNLLIEQREKFKEIDINLNDLNKSIEYFEKQLEAVSKADRQYSQENIKRKLTAERELSEVIKIRDGIQKERDDLVSNGSKKLANSIYNYYATTGKANHKLQCDEVIMKQIKTLMKQVYDLLDEQEERYRDYNNDMIDCLEQFRPFLTSESLDNTKTSIFYSHNDFNQKVKELILKDTHFN